MKKIIILVFLGMFFVGSAVIPKIVLAEKCGYVLVCDARKCEYVWVCR